MADARRRRAPPIAWAKVSADLDSNRKIRQAGNLGRQVFEFVLRQNAGRGSRGSIPSTDVEPWYLADRLMISESDAAEGVRRAADAALIAIDEGRVVIVGWEEDWGRSALSESEARQLRRVRARANHSRVPDPDPEEEKREDQKRAGPDCVRTMSGHDAQAANTRDVAIMSICQAPRSPPRTADVDPNPTTPVDSRSMREILLEHNVDLGLPALDEAS